MLAYALGGMLNSSASLDRLDIDNPAVMASLELVGKVALGNGLARAIRPKK